MHKRQEAGGRGGCVCRCGREDSALTGRSCGDRPRMGGDVDGRVHKDGRVHTDGHVHTDGRVHKPHDRALSGSENTQGKAVIQVTSDPP